MQFKFALFCLALYNLEGSQLAGIAYAVRPHSFKGKEEYRHLIDETLYAWSPEDRFITIGSSVKLSRIQDTALLVLLNDSYFGCKS